MIADSTLFKIIVHVVAIPGIAFACYVIFRKAFYNIDYSTGHHDGYEAGRKSVRKKRSKFK
jgi:hypothetical protein